MTQITICAECKCSKLVSRPEGGVWSCCSMLQSERDLITGDWSKPLKECSCKKNDGKCPEYRNKETGLPIEKPGWFWAWIDPIVTVAGAAAFVGLAIAGGVVLVDYLISLPILDRLK